MLRGLAIATTSLDGVVGTPSDGTQSPGAAPSLGLWSPGPSALRLMDDGGDDGDDVGWLLPDFDQRRFATAPTDGVKNPSPAAANSPSACEAGAPSPRYPPKGPTFAAPIKIQTNVLADRPAVEVKMSQLGGGLGGL